MTTNVAELDLPLNSKDTAEVARLVDQFLDGSPTPGGPGSRTGWRSWGRTRQSLVSTSRRT
jgi:hypothetical protein